MLEGQGLPACAHHLVGVAAASMQLAVAPGANMDTAGAPLRVLAQLGRRRCLRQSLTRPVHPRYIRLGVGPELQQRQPEQQQQGLERPRESRPQMIIQQPSEITVAQLFEAYYDCRRGKRTTSSALTFEIALEDNLMQLLDELRTGRWWPAPATIFAITRPKPREVWASQFRDRIVHHLVYRAINPLFEPSFIIDSCACIKGRGTLYAAGRLERHLRSTTESWSKPVFVLKADIANFFGSIRHDDLFAMLAHRVKDPTMLELCRRLVFQDVRRDAIIQDAANTLVRVPPHKSLFQTPAGIGLPIGNLSSQFFANVYLDPVDQMVKRRLGLRYVRYVDDMVLIHHEPKVLLAAAAAIRESLAKIGLRLAEHKTYVAPAAKGVDFVGHVIRPHRRSGRPKTHRNALRRLVDTAMPDFRATCNSYLGLYRHGGSRAQIIAICRIALRRSHWVAGDLTKVAMTNPLKSGGPRMKSAIDSKAKARKMWFGACKDAGLNEEARRAVQARICRKDSASTMTVRDFNACVADLKARGLVKDSRKGGGSGYRAPSSKPYVRKVFAIWGDMCRAGIPETPTRDGLLAFIKRMTEVDDPEWMTLAQANTVTEGLKAWRKRAEGSTSAASEV